MLFVDFEQNNFDNTWIISISWHSLVLGHLGGISLIFVVIIFVVAFMPHDYSNEKIIRETTTYNQTVVITSADGIVLSNETETITEIREYPVNSTLSWFS